MELSPGAVTKLPAWKLDAVYCAGLKVGPPQASLAALLSLHELLIACESRLVSADGNIVRQVTRVVAQLRLARRTEFARGLRHSLSAEPRELDFISFSTKRDFGA